MLVLKVSFKKIANLQSYTFYQCHPQRKSQIGKNIKNNRMKTLHFFLLLFFVTSTLCFAQLDFPLFIQSEETAANDWLLSQADMPAKLYKTERNELVFANGLVSRTFTIEPNCSNWYRAFTTKESFLRSVRPEAEIAIDGITFEVGGLNGQPIHNYCSPVDKRDES